ncbi:SGNH/GDSL hydrolase family protein [Brevundimonas bacteroides]|uniref:SGNH/GDSL hydrolase family protein n=1 Tax=Brevundimonas bacteroides TaxID=74311 RepID=UPI0004965E0E|nr:autotransporter domain-containing protein [Brevundimonas bacteroides]
MKRFLRGAALGALTLAAAAALSGTASAQTYNRLVVFGDSLSDNGNLFLASGGTQPTSPPYFRGRFSNGPVFTELLGFNAARFNGSVNGSINYAYGGSRTDNVVAFPPGMRQQLTTYTTAGGTFRSGDLVSVLGGANNIFQALGAFPTQPAAVQANPTGYITPFVTGAVSDISFIVGDIASRGAGTILVTNLPRLGVTPQFRPTPLAPLADFAGTAFNTGLQSALLTLAPTRPNTNIILFDLAKVGDALASNPGLFGLTNVTASCFNGVTVCPDPQNYLYWDGVHPTAAGHALIANLANDYLYYGDRGAPTTLQGETAYRHREDALDMATASLSGSAAWEAGTSVSVSGLYDTTETDARGPVGAAEATSYGGRMAFETGTQAWRFGVAGGYRRADVEAGATGFVLETLSADVYGGWRSGALFVNAAAGIAAEDFEDIRRQSALGVLVQSGVTEGSSVGVRGQAGLWFDMGGLRVSPRVAVTYASSDIDGYVEQGLAATYEYRDREVKGVTGEVALRAEGDVGGFGVFAEGGYRDSLDDSSQAVRVGILNNPAQVLARDYEDPFGGSFIAAAGVTGKVGILDIEIGYRGRFGDQADGHTGGVTITLPLG